MPARNVFISHATEDRAVAEDICSRLEQHGVTCWMAPRDIVAGTHYAEAIVLAIEEVGAAVLVLSEAANASIHVRNEIERVVANAKPIFPVRVRNALPSRSLELYVSAAQWVDAWQPPLDAKIAELASAIKALVAPRRQLLNFHDAHFGLRVKAVGVGGAGVRAVGAIMSARLSGRTYVAANSYAPSLHGSSIPTKMQLGERLLAGASASGSAESGRAAAEESVDSRA